MLQNKSASSHQISEKAQSELITLARQALLSGMAYEEVQAKIARFATRMTVSEVVEAKNIIERPKTIRERLPKPVRLGALIIPLLLLTTGVYLVGSAVVPILGYYVGDESNILQRELTSPIPRYQVMDITPLVIIPSPNMFVASEEKQEAPEVVSDTLDFTNLANWFGGSAPELVEKSPDGGPVQNYSVSIPSLKIENAKVEVGGTDLEKSLIAYPGTALPGEFGAPVIFGHSVLRQFYNPSEKNPNRYNSIFSTIMTLKVGVDKIFIEADGVKYTYLVQQKTEVKPEDVFILTQQYDAKRLKLVTCVPEGTYLRRGVIIAQLVDESN
jgi:LPXTG-site transpeptidase (sortase) family protein